jgi:hypothetical protein
MHNLWLFKMRLLNKEPFPDQKMIEDWIFSSDKTKRLDFLCNLIKSTTIKCINRQISPHGFKKKVCVAKLCRTQIYTVLLPFAVR